MDERPLPAGVTVRRATLADAGVLGSMRAAMHAEIRGRPDVGPDVVAYATDCEAFFARELRSEPPWISAWVARSDEGIVGSATLSVAPGYPRLDVAGVKPEGRIRSVYVHPTWRGRGIARRLMLAAIAESQRLGVVRLTLGASPMGRALYESLGFRAKGDEMAYDP